MCPGQQAGHDLAGQPIEPRIIGHTSSVACQDLVAATPTRAQRLAVAARAVSARGRIPGRRRGHPDDATVEQLIGFYRAVQGEHP